MSNDLTKAKELICNYSLEEFGYEPDFRNLSSIEVAYTTTDNDYPIQAAIDLNKLNINKYINYILVEQRHYPSMQELIDGELYALDFNDLTAYTDEQLEYALSKTYGERSQEELQIFNEEDKLSLYGETALLPDELEGKWHIVGTFEHNDEHLFILESASYGLQNGYAVVDCEENVVAQNIRSISEAFPELPPMLIRVTAEYAYDMWEHGFSVFFPDGSPAAPYVPNMHDSGISNALSQLDDYIMSAYPEDIWKMWDRSRLIDKLDNLNDHIIWYSVDHSIDEYHYLELENFIDDYGYEEQTGENQYSWREGWTVWQNIDIMLSQGKIPPIYEWLHDVTNDFEGVLEVDFAEVSKALAEYIGKYHPEYNFEPIETENEPER